MPVTTTSPAGPLRRFGARLRYDKRGLALIEFAYSLPILTALGFTGVEVANFAIANMRVSQIAMTVADNLSRAKQSVPLGLPQLREVDINDALLGARIQGGDTMAILEHGRIIVSSLQRTSTGRQTIAWQRCKGKATTVSSYGSEGTTQPNSGGGGFQGMGPAGAQLRAEPNTAIIFAEVVYEYQPIMGNWIGGPRQIKREAAFYVRDDRDLVGGPENNGIHDPAPKATKSACNLYNSTF